MHRMTIRGIPEKLYERIKESAQENHRSIADEVLFWLERVIPERREDRDGLHTGTRASRERTELPPLDNKSIGKVKGERQR